MVRGLYTLVSFSARPALRACLWLGFGLTLWAASTIAAAAAPGAALDGSASLLIKQFSEPSGEQEIYLSPLGIKIQSKRKDVCAMLLPPYNEAFIFNGQSKRIYYCRPEQLKSPYAQSMALLHAVTFSETELAARRPTVYKGLSAVVFGFSQAFDQEQRLKMSRREIAFTAPAAVECIEASKLKVKAEIVHLLDRFYGFPLTEGLPLDFSYKNFKGKQHHYMYTSEISAANFKASDYIVPKGYTRVKDVRELVLDDSADDSIEMMIGK